jgi:hypothetical protein
MDQLIDWAQNRDKIKVHKSVSLRYGPLDCSTTSPTRVNCNRRLAQSANDLMTSFLQTMDGVFPILIVVRLV